jgi:sugar lactone lactonase YvrE
MIMVKEKGPADASLYTKFTRQTVNSKLTLGDNDIRAPPASRVSIVSQSPYGVNMPVSFHFRFGGQSADRYVTLSDVLLSIVSGTTRNLILNFNLSRPGQLPVGVDLYRNTSASTTGGTLIASSTVPPTFTASNLYPYYHYYTKATLNSQYTSNVVNTNNPRIETVVGNYGNNIAGFGGDGGSATAASVRLSNPRGIAMSPVRDILFIADNGNSRIRAVNFTSSAVTVCNVTIGPGNIESIVGTGAAGPIQQSTPDVDVDTDETLYIYETDARISRIDGVTGVRTVIAGTGTAGHSGDGGLATAAQVTGGQRIIVAKSRRFVCISQFANSTPRIRCINIGSTNLSICGKIILPGCIDTIIGTGVPGMDGDGGASTSAKMTNPRGLCISPDENVIYIADSDTIRGVNVSSSSVTVFGRTIASGNIDTIFNNSNATIKPDGPLYLGTTWGVDIDNLGNMYLSNVISGTFVRVERDTNTGQIISGVTNQAAPASPPQPNGVLATAGLYDNPGGVAFDSRNNIYVLDRGTSRFNGVRRIY